MMHPSTSIYKERGYFLYRLYRLCTTIISCRDNDNIVSRQQYLASLLCSSPISSAGPHLRSISPNNTISSSYTAVLPFRYLYLGTEHLLLGLLREGEGIAAGVLSSMGLKLGQVREETLATLQRQQQRTAEETEKTLQASTEQKEAAEEPSLQEEQGTIQTDDEDDKV